MVAGARTDQAEAGTAAVPPAAPGRGLASPSHDVGNLDPTPGEADVNAPARTAPPTANAEYSWKAASPEGDERGHRPDCGRSPRRATLPLAWPLPSSSLAGRGFRAQGRVPKIRSAKLVGVRFSRECSRRWPASSHR